MAKNEYKTDLRTLKTKNAIHMAFRSLLSECTYQKITVTALTEAANINRKTFYLHYETMDDLLQELRDEILFSGINELSSFELPTDIAHIVALSFTYLVELPRIDFQIVYYALTTLGEFGFIEQLKKSGLRIAPGFCENNSAALHFSMVFLVNTIIRFYYEWRHRQNICSMDEAIAITCRFLENGLKTI